MKKDRYRHLHSTATRYLMEHGDESHRLELKTNTDIVSRQLHWAGLREGMQVADVGCGPGKITALMHQTVGPGGTAVGIDFSRERIAHAEHTYARSGLSFVCRNIFEPLEDLGAFDFVLIRFLLEYYRSTAYDIVRRVARIVKPGGILCLVDLDHNCLNQYGISTKLKNAISLIMEKLTREADFDPHMGIKLYSMLYDLEFDSIDVIMDAHHLIFGNLDEIQAYDWTKKVEVAARNSGYGFDEFQNGFDGFVAEFKSAFSDPRRFVYTPVICCRGIRKR